MGLNLKTTEQIQAEQGQVTRDGVYTLGRNRFRIRAGDVLPKGAVMDDAPDEQRMRPEAPENRMVESAPQNRGRRSRKGREE